MAFCGVFLEKKELRIVSPFTNYLNAIGFYPGMSYHSSLLILHNSHRQL